MWLKKQANAYKQFVEDHPTQVKRIEEALRLGTMMIPLGRLGVYSEVINEGLYSILGNISSVHDYFIHDRSIQDQNSSLPKLFLKKLRMLLTFISNIEVVTEMYLRQFVSNQIKRKFIVLVEWFKAVSKIIILFHMRRTQKKSLLIANGQYVSKIKSTQPELQAPQETRTLETSDTTLTEDGSSFWIGKRTGKKFKLPHQIGHLSNMKSKLVPGSSNVGPETPESKADDFLCLLGELLNIARPLVTLYNRNWIGFCTAVLLDIVSFRCIALSYFASVKNPENKSSRELIFSKLKGKDINYDLTKMDAIAKNELSRRALLFFLYLLRNPLYKVFTLAMAKRFQRNLSKLPLANRMGNFVEDTLNYYHKVHFYTSGS